MGAWGGIQCCTLMCNVGMSVKAFPAKHPDPTPHLEGGVCNAAPLRRIGSRGMNVAGWAGLSPRLQGLWRPAGFGQRRPARLPARQRPRLRGPHHVEGPRREAPHRDAAPGADGHLWRQGARRGAGAAGTATGRERDRRATRDSGCGPAGSCRNRTNDEPWSACWPTMCFAR